MGKLFLLIISLWQTSFASGQIVDKRVDSFVNEQSIDSFIIYSYPCIGYSHRFDTCLPSDTHYLLWVKDDKYYVRQFKTCKTSRTISIDSINPLLFYIINKQTINNEEIELPAYYDYRKKEKGIDTVMILTAINHSCHHTFSLNLKSKKIKKSVDVFNLDFNMFDTGQKNIHYEYNQKTKLKLLIDDMTSLTTKLDKEF